MTLLSVGMGRPHMSVSTNADLRQLNLFNRLPGCISCCHGPNGQLARAPKGAGMSNPCPSSSDTGSFPASRSRRPSATNGMAGCNISLLGPWHALRPCVTKGVQLPDYDSCQWSSWGSVQRWCLILVNWDEYSQYIIWKNKIHVANHQSGMMPRMCSKNNRMLWAN